MKLYIVDANGTLLNSAPAASSDQFWAGNDTQEGEALPRPAGWGFGSQCYATHNINCMTTVEYSTDPAVTLNYMEFKVDVSRHGSTDAGEWFTYRALGEMSADNESKPVWGTTSHALGLNLGDDNDQSKNTFFSEGTESGVWFRHVAHFRRVVPRIYVWIEHSVPVHHLRARVQGKEYKVWFDCEERFESCSQFFARELGRLCERAREGH